MTERETESVSHVRFNWTVIGIIGSLLLQSAALVAWGAKLDQRVAELEQKVESSAGLAETVARVDERTKGLVASSERIELRLNDNGRRREGS